ncbi:type II secretion system F family protein [Terriglobus roseus]|uniref:Tight adherence protein B n=1 Tax=Terriglobus roseus TaxID=392734 RepID=A0A1G7PBB6_9BACT|nr:type II secretion system F family protein [Terriglobus roseus]SDF83511.1 tight adherence protein B [Terriglobus roseus]
MWIALCFALLTSIIFGAVMYGTTPSKVATEAELRLQTLVVFTKPSQPKTLQASLEKKVPNSYSWVEKYLEGTRLLRHIRLLLLQSRSDWSPGGVILTVVCIAVALPLLTYLVTANPILTAAAFAFSFAPVLWLRIKRQRRIKDFESALPQALEMFARSLRAGHAIPVAIGVLAEEAPLAVRLDFAEVHRDQNYGLPIRDAFSSMLERVPSRDLRIFVTGLLIQKDTGGNLPDVMDRIVAVIRDRVRIQGEVRTHTAQGRLTGWILCLLPVGLMLVINAMSPGYSRILFTDPMGRKLLYTGVVLLCLGVFTIRQIIRGIEV